MVRALYESRTTERTIHAGRIMVRRTLDKDARLGRFFFMNRFITTPWPYPKSDILIYRKTLKLGKENYPVLHVDSSNADWFLVQEMIEKILNFPERVFVTHDGYSMMPRQHSKWGPEYLLVEDHKVFKATMGNSRRHKFFHDDFRRHSMNHEWFTPEGLWTGSEGEYLAREPS